MDSVFSRTSVTVDEAVAILLGWFSGPRVFRARSEELSEDEQEELDSLFFCLHENLQNEMESLVSDLAEAIFDKLDKTDIEARRVALQHHRSVVDQANTYLSAIEDELNKGVASALRVDETRSNHRPYITLSSLDEWAASKGYGVQVLVPVPIAMPPEAELPKIKEKQVRRKLRDQEEAIVEEIERQGYNPLELPKNKSGIAGVKSKVKGSIQDNDLFGGKESTVFKKAWDRLLGTKEIIYKN